MSEKETSNTGGRNTSRSPIGLNDKNETTFLYERVARRLYIPRTTLLSELNSIVNDSKVTESRDRNYGDTEPKKSDARSEVRPIRVYKSVINHRAT